MKLNPSISVSMATVNTSPGLFKSLTAYFSQTVKPLEIVVVCDSKNFDQINRFLKTNQKNQRVKLIEFNGDKNEARNIGFSQLSGKFVIFVDADMIPGKNLIEECSKIADKFDALIIPEAGVVNGGNLAKIYALEKELVCHDPDALTPRLFRCSLYSGGEMPFDKKFGVLDEWGFSLRLKSKKPRVGTLMSSGFTVIDKATLGVRIAKSFQKGRSLKNLMAEDKAEAFKRTNPVKRGIQFYWSQSGYFKRSPIIFMALLLIKLVEAIAFFLGFIYSLI